MGELSETDDVIVDVKHGLSIKPEALHGTSLTQPAPQPFVPQPQLQDTTTHHPAFSIQPNCRREIQLINLWL